MRKLGWYAVSAAVAAIILGGTLLLVANLYVQSQTVQGQIRRALAANLKMPVEIKKITLTPWDGLRIDSISARPESGPEDFLSAKSFRVDFAFLPLFHKRLVVRQVLLDQPDLAWAQNGEGRWQFPPGQPGTAKPPAAVPEVPTTQPPAVPPSGPVAPAASPASPTASTMPAGPAAARAARSAQRPSRIAVDVDRLKVRHGVLDFLDNQRRTVGRFEEVNLDTKVSGTDHAAGALWFGKAMLPRAGVTFRDFHSDFTYGDRGLDLSDGNGRLAGGKIGLSCHIGLQEAGSPFKVSCRIEGVSLDELLTEAGGRPGFAQGRLRGEIQASGLSGDKESRRANGQVQLVDASFNNFPLLKTIGEALRIEDLSHLQFKKAQLDYSLEGAILHVRPLVLVSNDLQISAQGDYNVDNDRLALQARLTIDRAVGRQLPQFIESNFQASGSEAPEGSRFMDFDITGTLNKPKSDLFARVLQGSAGSLLENLFAPKKKHEKKAHKDDNSQPPTDENTSNGDAN